MARPVLFIACNTYLPGFRFGGPVRSIANLVEHLRGDFACRVVCGDRDLGDRQPYPHVDTKHWLRVGSAHVRYLAPADRTLLQWKKLLGAFPRSVLYLNSLFDPVFTLRPLLARAMCRSEVGPVIVAPRGELNPGALQFKRWKKRVYLEATRRLGLFRHVRWHATNEDEGAAIRAWFAPQGDVVVCPNLGEPLSEVMPRRRRAPRDTLRVVTLSRIVPIKNLLFSLEVMGRVACRVEFTILGPIEDKAYWSQCRQRMAALPPNIVVRYAGPIAPTEVAKELAEYDLFLLPTQGENFGHAILEALRASLPVLISDRTPWRDLTNRNAGWDLPLDDPLRFARIIESCAALNEDGWERLRSGAFRAAHETCRDIFHHLATYRHLFRPDSSKCPPVAAPRKVAA